MENENIHFRIVDKESNQPLYIGYVDQICGGYEKRLTTQKTKDGFYMADSYLEAYKTLYVPVYEDNDMMYPRHNLQKSKYKIVKVTMSLSIEDCEYETKE